MTRLGHGWAGRIAALALTVPMLGLPASAVFAAPAPVWTVNKAASRLRFQSSVGGTPFTGAFGRWDAAIRFDPRNLPSSSVIVKIDMASARTGAADKDGQMPGSDWFATAQFAQATWAAKSFRDLGGGKYQALGTLTLRGNTHPLPVNFTLVIQGDQVRMNGTAVVDRHQFGVGQGQFAGADTVPFAVQVGIAIVAKRG